MGERRRATLTHLASRPGASVRFSDISVDVKGKRVLNGVGGFVARGELLAVMGPSGSGKTTFFNVLAGRVKSVSGDLFLDGQRLNKRLRRQMCYVLQNDLLFPYLTLFETFKYAALLRMPQDMPFEKKMAAVEEVIDVLGVRHCKDTIIGNPVKRGLSGGEKKRASIGQELLANPRLLVMDEPTSGLDSHIAHSLLCTIQDLAVEHGRTIITSIHQPSSQIFHLFNRLLLLSRGQVVYFGPGKDAVAYFSRLGFECPLNYNPADYLLDVVSSDDAVSRISRLKKQPLTLEANPSSSTGDLGVLAITDAGDVSVATTKPSVGKLEKQETAVMMMFDEKAATTEVSLAILEEGESTTPQPTVSFVALGNASGSGGADVDGEDDCSNEDDSDRWPSSFRQQMSVLMRRSFKNSFGDMLSLINIVQLSVLILVSCLIWFQVPRNEAHVRDITGYMFFIAVFFGFQPIIIASGSFLIERSIINRERVSGYYRLSAYFLSKTLTDLPLVCVLPSLYLIVTFPISGLGNAEQFFTFWIYLMLSVLVAQSFGQLTGAMAPNVQKSVIASSTLMITFLLGGGFYVSNFPSGLAWIKYISYINYSYHAFVLIVFNSDVTYHCDLGNIGTPYPQCVGATAHNVTINGVEIARELGVGTYALGWVSAVLISLIVVLRCCTYGVLRYLRKPTVA